MNKVGIAITIAMFLLVIALPNLAAVNNTQSNDTQSLGPVQPSCGPGTHDKDCDGYFMGATGDPEPFDCNDRDASVHPDAQEICGNFIDDNCNQQIDEGCPKQANLLFWNQTFRGCGLNLTEQQQVNSTFKANLNFAKGAVNETECKSLGSWYCDYSGRWKPNTFTNTLKNPQSSQKYNLVTTSTTPDGFQTGCCPSGWCYEGAGQGCYPNQTGHYSSQDNEAAPFSYLGVDYRCASGTWVPYQLKWDWNYQYNGACDATSDCYNSQETSQPSDDTCITDKGFPANPAHGDHYCVLGSWTTRTKFLALQLLQFVADNNIADYVLFCDEYGKTLNEYQYVTPSEQTVPQGSLTRNVEDFISQGCSGGGACANNFCTLRYGDPDSSKGKVIVAVSLNQPINSSTYSFLNTLNAANSICSSAQVPNIFTYCGVKDNVRILYNPTARSIVFTKESVTSLSGRNFFTAIISSITNLINRIIRNPPPSGLNDASYLSKIGDFNKIYIARHANIDTTAILEKKQAGQAMLINYTGFDFDVCKVPTIASMQSLGYLNCTKNEASYYIASDQPSAIALWPDFTAKLRQR